MADGGIDRRADEKMEFTTSKEVQIGKAEIPLPQLIGSTPSVLPSPIQTVYISQR
jgi:hypothetical protein